MIEFPNRRVDYLTAQQLADRWSIHIESIYRMPHEVLPFVRVPPGSRKARRRYPVNAVEAYEREELAS